MRRSGRAVPKSSGQQDKKDELDRSPPPCNQGAAARCKRKSGRSDDHSKTDWHFHTTRRMGEAVTDTRSPSSRLGWTDHAKVPRRHGGVRLNSPVITLTIERRSSAGVHSDAYTIGMSGGMVSGVIGNAAGAGRGQQAEKTCFSTSWDGDSLVIETIESRLAGAWSAHREVWSLDPGVAYVLSRPRW
jgi:hypothetical protein